MGPEEIDAVAAALGGKVVATSTLAGGFSHETCRVTLADGPVVVRFGGPDPAIEAAVMASVRRYVPVPEVLQVLPAPDGEGARPAMILEHVAGTPLNVVLAAGTGHLHALGVEVGRVVAGVSAVTFDRRGFFADAGLGIRELPPWSEQLPGMVATCMASTPPSRLDEATRVAWLDLCTCHAPALAAVDEQTRLVHADVNPKNILVTRSAAGWRVDALLDWEFSFAGCPYGDPANMARFGADYPGVFLDGFRVGYAENQPTDLPLEADWAYLGRILDMFALSDLVTRPGDHPVADRAAVEIRHWVADGVPRVLTPALHTTNPGFPHPADRVKPWLIMRT
jgi:aminoglycoside phosphotransferase (APT) family kinase protein